MISQWTNSAATLLTATYLLVGVTLTSELSAEPSSSAPSAPKTTTAAAKSKLPTTTIYVDDIHCKHCAQKLARKLFAVPSVVKVKANVAKNFAVVYPQAKKNVSPLKLWEAAEAAGFKVVRVEAPDQTYEEKPEQPSDVTGKHRIGQQKPVSTTKL